MLQFVERGEGPRVLLIHGAGPDADQWGAVADDLAADHRVVAYNRRGYGGAGEPVKDWARHIDDALELIDAGTEPVTVVGHSAGSIVASGAAVKRPEMTRALVLLDPILFAQRRPTLSLLRTVRRFQRQRRSDPEAAAELFFRWATSYSDGSGSAFDRMSAEDRHEMRARHQAVFADTDAGDGSKQIKRADLKRLKNVTIAQGELSDSWFAKNARALGRQLPDAKLVIVKASGHAMMLDNPLRVAEIIRSA